MAWLSDLAGRAEDMLNKLDQNAATVLIPSVPASNGRATNPNAGDVSEALTEVRCFAQSTGTLEKSVPTRSSNRGLDEFVVSAIEREIADNVHKGLSVDEELSATKIVLGEIKLERDRLKSEVAKLLEQIHSTNNGKQRLVDLERRLGDLQESQSTLEESNRQLTASHQKQVQLISELEITGAQLSLSLAESQEQLHFAKEESARVVNELTNYRARAQTSLQLKERIIDELRLNSSAPVITDAAQSSVTELEIEQLRNERKDNLSELESLKLKMENYQGCISRLELKVKELSCESTDKITNLSQELANVQGERKRLHQEVSVLGVELQAVRMQSNEMNQRVVQQLYEKDQEIAGLRKRMNHGTGEAGGLDNRIKSLTQSLIQKQSSLEEVTADRNAMRIQLEKMEAQYRNLSQQVRREESNLVEMHSMTDDDKAQLPFMQENPFDNRVAKRMKRVIRASDSLGATLGGFLRRYPLLRILFLVYTVFLHVWVMFVLVSSTPN